MYRKEKKGKGIMQFTFATGNTKRILGMKFRSMEEMTMVVLADFRSRDW
jgi:hypothetical protein